MFVLFDTRSSYILYPCAFSKMEITLSASIGLSECCHRYVNTVYLKNNDKNSNQLWSNMAKHHDDVKGMHRKTAYNTCIKSDALLNYKNIHQIIFRLKKLPHKAFLDSFLLQPKVIMRKRMKIVTDYMIIMCVFESGSAHMARLECK